MTEHNERTLAAALTDAARRWPGRPAIQFGDWMTTYAGLEDLVVRLAAAYRGLGVRRGDRVVCQVGNRPEHLVAAATAWACAAIHVAADHKLPGPELSGYLHRTDAKALLYAPIANAADPYEPLRIVQKQYPEVRVIVVGGDPLPGTMAFQDLIDAPLAAHSAWPNPPTAEDPAAIFTTSGTTGSPKMPMGYHGKLHRSWTRLGEELGFGPEDVHLGYLPLAHGLGLMLMTAALMKGSKLVLLERFSAAAVLPLIERQRATVLHGSPTHFRLLLDRLDGEPCDIGSLRIGVGSGAAFTPALLRWIFERMDMDLLLMYGASEGVGVGTTNRAEMLGGSVGRPVSGSVAIVNEAAEPLPPGRVGEIAFSRAVSPVRYWEAPHDGAPAGPAPEQATGWYHSGDLGRLDGDGRLYVLGRVRDQINRGGLKVDPLEVEEALLRRPEVADAAVLGMANPMLGEVVCACVVPVTGRAVSLPALRDGLARELAEYKLPEELRIFRRIPRTGLGKVNGEVLRAEIAAAG
jgi:acyl-CoA synthetase (AMP-forming)/AMP-acid ligase II